MSELIDLYSSSLYQELMLREAVLWDSMYWWHFRMSALWYPYPGGDLYLPNDWCRLPGIIPAPAPVWCNPFADSDLDIAPFTTELPSSFSAYDATGSAKEKMNKENENENEELQPIVQQKPSSTLNNATIPSMRKPCEIRKKVLPTPNKSHTSIWETKCVQDVLQALTGTKTCNTKTVGTEAAKSLISSVIAESRLHSEKVMKPAKPKVTEKELIKLMLRLLIKVVSMIKHQYAKFPKLLNADNVDDRQNLHIEEFTGWSVKTQTEQRLFLREWLCKQDVSSSDKHFFQKHTNKLVTQVMAEYTKTVQFIL